MEGNFEQCENSTFSDFWNFWKSGIPGFDPLQIGLKDTLAFMTEGKKVGYFYLPCCPWEKKEKLKIPKKQIL